MVVVGRQQLMEAVVFVALYHHHHHRRRLHRLERDLVGVVVSVLAVAHRSVADTVV